jgi:hypothetical protein
MVIFLLKKKLPCPPVDVMIPAVRLNRVTPSGPCGGQNCTGRTVNTVAANPLWSILFCTDLLFVRAQASLSFPETTNWSVRPKFVYVGL